MAHLTLIDLTFGQERTAIWYQYHEPGATPSKRQIYQAFGDEKTAPLLCCNPLVVG